jgi:phage FluMu gp28-like protein
MQILSGSGDNPENRTFLEKLERAFPERECVPLLAWISTFYGFQQNWLLDTSRFSLLNKCRQIGASHTYAAASILWGLLGESTSIVSVGERESSEVLAKVAKHAEGLARLGSEWARPRAKSATRLTLQSGGTIVALPATSGGRGQSGNMLLDEAAYYEHPEEVWDGASATVLHGYRMRVSSTPNGTGNLFHKLVRDREKLGYRLHEVSLTEARADGLRVDDAECWKMARGNQRVYDQLFNCKFLDNEAQYIPSGAIEDCTTDEARLGPNDGNTFAGLDIGRTADLTALYVIVKSVDGRWRIAHSDTCKRTSQQDIDRMVDSAFGRWRIRRICIDSSGLGAFPAEQIQRRHGRSRVEPVIFTLQTKEDLATVLYSVIVGDLIRLPRPDAALRDDLASLRRIVTTAGNVRYDAPHTDEGHADRAWALALALHAAGQQPISPARDHGMV